MSGLVRRRVHPNDPSSLRAITGIALAQPSDDRSNTEKRQTLEFFSNLLVEEEVQRAIDDFNGRMEDLGIPEDQHLRIIARGEFLEWLTRLGSAIWPVEISPMNALLQMLVADGTNPFPLEKLDLVLRGLLGLREKRDVKNLSEFEQRTFSAAIMTAISLTNFEAAKNHYAAICAWTMYTNYVLGACDRYGYKSRRGAEQAIKIAKGAIFLALTNIAVEVDDRVEHFREVEKEANQAELYDLALVGPNGLSDFVVAPGRKVLITALMSLYWFWCEEDGWPDAMPRSSIERFLPVPAAPLEFWGEGALPQILIHFWLWRELDATNRPNHAIGHLLSQIVSMATSKHSPGMPSPYYSYEEVVRHKYNRILRRTPDILEREKFQFTSFVAEGVLHLLVRTNLKSLCRALWPDFSRISGTEFRPHSRWQFCLRRCEEGKTVSVQHPPMKAWNDLKHDARSVSAEQIPPLMRRDRILLMLFVIICPHRFTPSAIRYLGHQFCDVWFLDPPLV